MHVVTEQHSRQRCNNCCTSMRHKTRTTGAASLQASGRREGPSAALVPNARQEADQALTRPRVFACTPLRHAVVSIKQV